MSTDDLAEIPNKELFNQGQLWIDGWYLFDEGNVSGPYRATEIFSEKKFKHNHTMGKMVSRKGLKQWYHLESVHKIFRSQKPRTNFITKPENEQEIYPKKIKVKKNKRNRKQVLHSPVYAKKILNLQRPDNQVEEFDVTSTKPQIIKIEPKKSFPKRSINYYHLIYKGRLRLGSLQNPWYLGFINFFMTFGFGWKSWYEQALIETTYHLDDPHATERFKKIWLCLVPVYHMYMAYRLAKIILQMEVQNHYRITSPTKVFFLSLIPPFAMVYLQKSLNQHWLRHLHHAAKTHKG